MHSAEKCSERDEEEGMQVQNEVEGLLPVTYDLFFWSTLVLCLFQAN